MTDPRASPAYTETSFGPLSNYSPSIATKRGRPIARYPAAQGYQAPLHSHRI